MFSHHALVLYNFVYLLWRWTKYDAEGVAFPPRLKCVVDASTCIRPPSHPKLRVQKEECLSSTYHPRYKYEDFEDFHSPNPTQHQHFYALRYTSPKNSTLYVPGIREIVILTDRSTLLSLTGQKRNVCAQKLQPPPLFYNPCTALALPPSPVDTQIRGHIAGSLLHPSHYGTCLHFYRGEKNPAFSFLVDSRRIAPTHAARRSQQLLIRFSCICANKVKISPRWESNLRTNASQ